MTPSPVLEHRDAVAIIGMAARLPGAADVGSYWLNLREGVESISRHTREEILARGVRPDLADNPNYVPASGSLDDVECFDAAFFGYSPHEAAIMDPQHRIFLECAYHALEDAAYDTYRYPGLVSVFAGATMNTYLLYNVMSHTSDVVATVGDMQTMVGNDKDFMTTRVSHKLDLRGPSIAVQAACSSSLVAIHMAVRNLIDEECDMALAGGASVRLPHGAGYLSLRGISPADGHCRALDAAASGSIVGNGVGVVVLKRLADAVRDGDQIHAVIRGSAVSNDGRVRASFTAPSVEGQSRAVIRALRRAGVTASDIQFVEAHGTGTPLGDPIEVAALTRAFREWTDQTGYCWLGSVKPNIGHLDAAAGVAGLIKAVLALKHHRLPPVVNFRRPNPKLQLETTPFRVPTELTRLESDAPLLASVNSLAMGGTNAHVVLEEAPPARAATASARRRHAVLLSAGSPEALERMSQNLGQWAKEHPSANLADVAYTLATGRRELGYRRSLLAHDMEDIASALSARGSRRQRQAHAREGGRTAFLFPGQGSQRLGMGARLAAHDPVFARHLDTVLDLFRERAGLDLRECLYPDPAGEQASDARLADTQVTQPALFSVEWALGRTLLDYGVRPYAMLGHSIGELVAAALVDVLALPDAVDLVALRGEAMSRTPEGAMMYVNLPAAEVAARIGGRDVSIAAVNAPAVVVVSGTPEAIDDLAAALRADQVTCGGLRVNRAFHSPLVAPAATALAEGFAGRELGAPSNPVASNVTGTYLTAAQAVSPEYWAEQMRQPVRFADGVQTLLNDGVDTFIEVGPGQSLSTLVQAAAPEAACLPAMSTGESTEATDFLELLTEYWLLGGAFDPAAYYRGELRNRISLPAYPFTRTRHWLEIVPQELDRTAAAQRAPAESPASATAQPVHPPAPGSTRRELGRTPVQAYLTECWSALLGLENIGLHDSFFDLGGHSLLAMQFITMLEADNAVDLEVTALFETPTIAELAARLEDLGFVPPAGLPRVDPARVRADTTPPATAAPPAVCSQPPQTADGAEHDAELAALMAEIESLSDDEVRAQLATMESEDER